MTVQTSELSGICYFKKPWIQQYFSWNFACRGEEGENRVNKFISNNKKRYDTFLFFKVHNWYHTNCMLTNLFSPPL